MTGTVSSINAAAHTITVFQDNGQQGVFQDMAANHRVSLDKRIAADTTTLDNFKKQGAYVIVFYYGNSDTRTVAAIKNLGAGPFASTTGTFKKIEGHRTLVVTDSSGKEQTFKIGPQTVAEGMFGAIPGSKFDAEKGDQIRVVSQDVNGSPTALFIAGA
ncbi:MAG: hypothetical protein ACLGSD_13290 [Acidobacteriota bacterium]